jgi:phage/plasmid-like protein (TIGR03299 family)
LATTAQFTSVRVVCNNTLHIALGDNDGAVKVSHRTLFDAQSVKRQLGIAVSSWDGFMTRMKALAERKVTDAQAEAFLNRVLAASGVVPTTDKALKALLEMYRTGQGADLPSAHGTAWGLVNAVTGYVDHQKRARSVDHRLDSAWFGPGAQLKQAAWDEAVKLVA